MLSVPYVISFIYIPLCYICWLFCFYFIFYFAGRPLGMLLSNIILWGSTLTNFSLVRHAIREHF